MRTIIRFSLTALVVLAAVALLAWRYQDYLANPWTRDGQVNANVIQVAPRISGPVVELPIRDNQRVKAGDLLFRIDPRTFANDLAQAEANFDKTRDDLDALQKQVDAAEAVVEQSRSAISQAESEVVAAQSTLDEAIRQLTRNETLLKSDDVSQARVDLLGRDRDVALAELRQAEAGLLGAKSQLRQTEAQLARAVADRGQPGEDNAQLRAAAAEVETARLNLEFTEVRASVDGLITRLDIRLGSQAVANQPILALIDEKSFWIDAFFRETLISDVHTGDTAIITLMSDRDKPLKGHVDSIGWGIERSDGTPGVNLLPQVEPTFQWIRLAQRIPVRITIDEIPPGITLRVGQTTSVLVRAGEGGEAVAVPAVMQ